MAIHRLNHAVLFVRDVARSVAFYRDVLDFSIVTEMEAGTTKAAFLRAADSTNDHDLGLFELGAAAGPSGAGHTTVGLYHLAWEVDTLRDLAALRDRLAAAGALVGATDHQTTKSLYGKDPDGLEFEIVWLIPADLLVEADVTGRNQLLPLDLEREIERFGADTPGGIGVSRIAAS